MTVGTGSNRALVVCFATSVVVSSVTVTWDSAGTPQTMTAITGATAGSVDVHVNMYGLVAPHSGNLTLSVSWSGSCEGIVFCYSFTGVDQTGGATTFPHGNGATGSAGSPAVTITSATGNFTVAAASNGGNAFTAWTGGTSASWDNSGATINAAFGNVTGAASVAYTGSAGTPGNWAAGGTDILAAVTAAAPDAYGQTIFRLQYPPWR